MSVSHFFGAIPSPLVSPYGGSKSLGGTAFGAPLLPRKYLFLPGLAAAIVLIAAHGASAQSGPSPAGEEVLFEQNCAVCHNNPATRAPARASLGVMSPSFIVEALTNGILKAQGANLSSNRRIALAEFLTGKKIGAEAPMGGRCNGAQPPFAPDASSTSFNGWGGNVENWRFQPQPGIAAAQLRRLEPKWAFGIPGVAAMFGQPAVVGGRVFFGAQNGHVYSLDTESGCYFWDYTAGAGVRTAITLGPIAGRYAPHSSATAGGAPMRLTPRRARRSGKWLWTTTPPSRSPARPPCSRDVSMFRYRLATTGPPWIRSSNVAAAGAPSLRSTRRPGRRCGRPIRSRRRSRRARTR